MSRSRSSLESGVKSMTSWLPLRADAGDSAIGTAQRSGTESSVEAVTKYGKRRIGNRTTTSLLRIDDDRPLVFNTFTTSKLRSWPVNKLQLPQRGSHFPDARAQPRSVYFEINADPFDLLEQYKSFCAGCRQFKRSCNSVTRDDHIVWHPE